MRNTMSLLAWLYLLRHKRTHGNDFLCFINSLSHDGALDSHMTTLQL